MFKLPSCSHVFRAVGQWLCPGNTAGVILLQAIDAVIASVEAMAREPETLAWPVFSLHQASEWKQVLSSFNASLMASQKAAQEVVDTCFRLELSLAFPFKNANA